MATKKIYFGSIGPHLYDDTSLVNDVDGLFPGATYQAVLTNGDMTISGDLSVEGGFYLGDPTVDGTWKLVTTGNKLLIQRRESGTYVTKGQFTP